MGVTRARLPKAAPYLTVIPSRVPRMKAHAELGDVRRAVAVRETYDPLTARMVASETITIYRWEDGAWTLVWRIEAGTPEDGLPWRRGL